MFKELSVLAIAALLLPGCDNILGGDEAYTPPPDFLTSVDVACNACTPAEATHPCPPTRLGVICSGIPTAQVGDTMLLCARSNAGQGRIGRMEWTSSNSEVATVAPAGLPVTHCLHEVSNAVFRALAPGSTMISVNELEGSRIVRTVSAPLTVSAK